MATTYVPPAVSSTGLAIPLFPAILQFLNQQYLALYGATTNLSSDSADAQWNAALALQIADLNAALQAVWLSFNPLTAIGTSLDLLGKLIGTARTQATYS